MIETPGDWLHTGRNKRVRLLKAKHNHNMYNSTETAGNYEVFADSRFKSVTRCQKLPVQNLIACQYS
jgi:hypothetical protein